LVPQATFTYEGISIQAVLASDEDILWLREFLTPWFDPNDDVADVEIRVTYDPVRFRQLLMGGPDGSSTKAFMLDTRYMAFPTWHVPGEDLAFYHEKGEILCLITSNRVELVCNDAKASPRTMVMRIIRELAMGAAQMTGGRFLHASAFVANGLAAIVTGPRQAGKTSLLSYILANSEAGFLTNDRLLVKDIGGTTQLRGMPTIVSVRKGTMQMFPEMERAVIDRRYSMNATLRECADPAVATSAQRWPDRYSLSPSQFSELLDSAPTRHARAGVLLFPRQTGLSGGLQLRRLDVGEARNRLQHCLFGHIGPDSLSEVFTPQPAMVKVQTAPDDAALLAGLGSSLPAFDCELGCDAYVDDQGVKQLLRLLDGQVGDSP